MKEPRPQGRERDHPRFDTLLIQSKGQIPLDRGTTVRIFHLFLTRGNKIEEGVFTSSEHCTVIQNGNHLRHRNIPLNRVV